MGAPVSSDILDNKIKGWSKEMSLKIMWVRWEYQADFTVLGYTAFIIAKWSLISLVIVDFCNSQRIISSGKDQSNSESEPDIVIVTNGSKSCLEHWQIGHRIWEGTVAHLNHMWSEPARNCYLNKLRVIPSGLCQHSVPECQPLLWQKLVENQSFKCAQSSPNK